MEKKKRGFGFYLNILVAIVFFSGCGYFAYDYYTGKQAEQKEAEEAYAKDTSWQVENTRNNKYNGIYTLTKFDENGNNTWTGFVFEVKNDEIWNIPKPSHMISSKTYHKNTVIPFIQNIKSYVNKIIKKCIDLTKQVKYLNQSTFKLKIQVNELNETIDKLIKENREIKNDLSAIRKALGHRQFQEILNQKKEREVNQNEKNNR